MNGKKANWIIAILALISVIAVSVTVWVLCFRNVETELAPDYAPKQEEEYAEKISGDTNEKMEQPSGGGSVNLTYSKQVKIDLHNGIANLLFANPGKSNQDVVLQIIIQDNVIVQSNLIKPGNQVKKLKLLNGKSELLSEGTYDGKLNVLYYDPKTAEKAIVNTEIPITVTVEK